MAAPKKKVSSLNKKLNFVFLQNKFKKTAYKHARKKRHAKKFFKITYKLFKNYDYRIFIFFVL